MGVSVGVSGWVRALVYEFGFCFLRCGLPVPWLGLGLFLTGFLIKSGAVGVGLLL